MAQTAERRRIGDTAEVFNDISFLAGLSPRLFFEDITLAFHGETSPAVPSALPPYHAVVVAKSGLCHPAGQRQGNGTGTSATNKYHGPDIEWFPQRVKHIPDIYALLHAIFNCGVKDTLVPNSILDRLGNQCKGSTALQRATLIQQAGELQKAFVAAVVNNVWGLPACVPSGKDGVGKEVRSPADIVPDQYYVFVMSKTGDIVGIDNHGPPQLIEPGKEKAETILTNGVVRKIQSIIGNDSRDDQTVVVGLVSREV